MFFVYVWFEGEGGFFIIIVWGFDRLLLFLACIVVVFGFPWSVGWEVLPLRCWSGLGFGGFW